MKKEKTSREKLKSAGDAPKPSGKTNNNFNAYVGNLSDPEGRTMDG